MRIDASQVLGQGGIKIKTGTGAATDALKEGDVVRAGVVSSSKNGSVTLKMENGQSFNAKLGADVKLSPGDVVLLEVTGKEKGQLSLSFSGVETAEEDLSAPQMNLVRGFTDKSLAQYASKLADLNMPVTEESARMMRELIAQNPGMSLDEAAFLASNKITGDESLMKAALATLAGGDKTDAMIARLLSLISEQDSPASALPKASPSVESTPAFTVNTANAAPLTELLTTIVKSFSSPVVIPAQGEQASATITQTIITQSDANVQTNAQNAEEILMQGKTQGEMPSGQGVQSGVQGEASAVSQNASGTLQGEISAAGSGVNASTASGNISSGETASTGANPAVTPETAATALSPQGSSTPAQAASSMGSVVAQLLSDIPEFSGTPQSALQRFSEMLLRVAGDSPETANSTETLAAQLDKLFTRIGKDDSDAGARLRDAREELFTRLALIEEAISRAAQPARAEMLVQTQKLMDHVRLLNSIDQFVYMQMPVQLNDERKAADLYVFKRKGGKRADPDNVNILLAIDLENMGHWEALVNIKNKEVSIQMEVPGEAEKEHFNSNTVLLHEMLDEAGFKLVSTNIKYAEKETTPLTALSAFDRYTGGKQGIIDFRI